MPLHRNHSGVLAATLGLFDSGCIFAAYLLAAWFVLPEGAGLLESLQNHAVYFLVLVVVWYSQAIDQRLFISRRGDALVPQLIAVAHAVFVSLMFCIFLLALFMKGGLDGLSC